MSTRTLRQWLALLALGAGVVVVALAGCSTPDPYTEASKVTEVTATAFPPADSIPLASAFGPPREGSYLGVYVPPAPFDPEAAVAFDREIDKTTAILMWYQPWEETNRSKVDKGALVSAWRRKKVPLITWEPWDPGDNARSVVKPGDQPKFTLRRIIDGDFDSYITSWARDLRDAGGPVIMRPMHEMNGRWYPWSGTTNGNTPEEYVRAWRHIHDIFRREGAANVTWMWSVNHRSLPNTPDNDFDAYYPGDEYTDWIGLSGFNSGTSPSSKDWRSFDVIYGSALDELSTYGKPICLAEMSTLGTPTARATWITDAFVQIRRQPQVKAVVYYNAREILTPPQDWRIETSKEAETAFREAVSGPYYIGGPAPELEKWAARLSLTQQRYLTGFKRVY